MWQLQCNVQQIIEAYICINDPFTIQLKQMPCTTLEPIQPRPKGWVIGIAVLTH